MREQSVANTQDSTPGDESGARAPPTRRALPSRSRSTPSTMGAVSGGERVVFPKQVFGVNSRERQPFCNTYELAHNRKTN